MTNIVLMTLKNFWINLLKNKRNMLSSENFYVQYMVDNSTIFDATLELKYRTEEYKQYWKDDIINDKHLHIREAVKELKKTVRRHN